MDGWYLSESSAPSKYTESKSHREHELRHMNDAMAIFMKAFAKITFHADGKCATNCEERIKRMMNEVNVDMFKEFNKQAEAFDLQEYGEKRDYSGNENPGCFTVSHTRVISTLERRGDVVMPIPVRTPKPLEKRVITDKKWCCDAP